MKKYKLIVQDTFNKLELDKVYNIKDNIIYDDGVIGLYRVTSHQLDIMFEEVVQ